MGLFDIISEMLSFGEVHAEAQEEEKEEETSGESEEKSEDGGEEDSAEEEEEEEEDEPVDPKDALEEECAESKECAPHKHHYDECVERVTKQTEENGKADEDCVEEFFHLAHCATNCAAPKLFKMLK